MSLKFKLLIPISALTLLILGVTTFLSSEKSFKAAEESAHAGSLRAARAFAGEISVSFEKAIGVPRAYSAVLAGRKTFETPSRDLANAELKSLLLANPEVLATWTTWEPNAFDGNDARWVGKPGHDSTGRFVPYWTLENGKPSLTPLADYEKPGAGDYYLVAKSRLKESIVEPYVYAVAGVSTLITSAAVPIIIDGQFKGVAGIDVGLKDIQALISKVKPYETSQAYLVTGSGNWVSHPQAELVAKPAQFPFQSEKLLGALHEGQELSLSGEDPKEHKDYLYTLVPVHLGNTGQNWGLVIRTPTQTILAGAKSMLWDQIMISLAGLLLLIGAVFALVHVIGGQIGKLTSDLNGSASEVSAAIHQLTSAGHVLSQAASESAASIEETVASLEEVNSMVQRNTESAVTAAQLSTESKDAAHEGNSEVRQLLEKMNEISQSSKKIEEIIHVIDDIAFQTNLLALNAAVEAARAGEQGKGFSVVADAVRTLAQKSAEAAKDITQLIQSSVTQIQEGTRKADLSRESLEKIVVSIGKVSTLNEEIAKASQEQATGLGQISQAMNQLDQSVQSNASSSEEIAASAQEIDAQSKVMKQVVEKIDLTIRGSAGEAPTHEAESSTHERPRIARRSGSAKAA